MTVSIHLRRRKVVWHRGTPYVTIDGEKRAVRKLLTSGDANTKLAKAKGTSWHTVGLSLAPARSSGVADVCGGRTVGCTSACLDDTGLGAVFRTIKIARIAKTVLFFRERQYFLDRLAAELHSERLRAHDRDERLAFRPNVFSDLPWERIAPELLAIADENYDYTKLPHRAGAVLPNYWITLSRSEDNDPACLAALRQGANVAVVFAGQAPPTWHGYPTVDGDANDLRFLDPRGGAVIALRHKFASLVARDRDLSSGFIVR